MNNDLGKIKVINVSGIGLRLIDLPEKSNFIMIYFRITIYSDNGYLGLITKYNNFSYPFLIDIVRSSQNDISIENNKQIRVTGASTSSDIGYLFCL